ncbi:MAG: type VI secretion system baseplate subunit TssK [Candidatus Cloacimonetes bacterium]|nr:type VI secretion system baseplate subunit TssK [Candidatus Cloacimonadota bacterium]
MRNIYWYEGLFLGEEHFISLENSIREEFKKEAEEINRYFWGIETFETDLPKLEKGILSLQKLRCVFSDGSRLDSEVNCVIIDKDLNSLKERMSNFQTVYLGLRKTTGNVLEIEDKSGQNTGNRYVRNGLMPERESSQVEYLKYQVFLFTDDMIPQTNLYLLMPILKIRYSGTGYIIDESYEPPRCHISDSIYLKSMLHELYDKLNDLHRELTRQQLPDKLLKGQMLGDQVLGLFKLNAISDKLIELRLALDMGGKGISPFWLYVKLRVIIGRLSTYYQSLPEISVFGESKSEDINLIAYNHDDLRPSINSGMSCVTHIVHSLYQKQENMLHLERNEDGYYLSKGKIADSIWKAERLYLMLSSVSLSESDCKYVSRFAKLDSGRRINRTVNNANDGVPLRYDQTPVGLARGKDRVFYFSIDKSSPKWRDIENEGSFGFFYEILTKSDKVSIIAL